MHGNAPALPQYDSGFRDQVANDLMQQMLPVQRMQQQAMETLDDLNAELAETPKRSASRDEWADYLAAHHSIVTDGKSRAELLAEYDALTQE